MRSFTCSFCHEPISLYSSPCSKAVTWVAGTNYPKGTIVKFTNGKYYLEVNNGTNGSDGTDPTISTWYWQPTSCS